MFWFPYGAAVPLSLVWPSRIATTSLTLAALVAAGQLALLALRAARARAAAVPPVAVPAVTVSPAEAPLVEDEHGVKQAAA